MMEKEYKEDLLRLKMKLANDIVADISNLAGIAPFNYDEYAKNPSRKVITREGFEVVSIEYCSGICDYPIIIKYRLGDGSIGTGTTTKTGHEWKDKEISNLDIFFDDRDEEKTEAPIENGWKCKAEREAETFKRKYPSVWQKYKNEDWDILELLEFAYKQGMLKGKSLVEHGKALHEKLDESTYLKIRKDDFEELRNQAESLQNENDVLSKKNEELDAKLSVCESETYLASLLAKRGYRGELVKETDIWADEKVGTNIIGTKTESIKIEG